MRSGGAPGMDCGGVFDTRRGTLS
ncbi:MAG: hypothetical protein HW388_588, partial [Dehalococcoidia bacterium]|nr:hypothetical protein [Dehalococcoidia bacterium]